MMNIIEARAYHVKAPLVLPYKTTFQTMTHRQAVIIFLTDENGMTGVGETYINFPVWSPYGRLAAYREAFFPVVTDGEIDNISAFMKELWGKFFRTSLQGGALGPTLQAISAISTALWDVEAKKKGMPLRNLFSSEPADEVKIYGSGINPPFLIDAIEDALDMGMNVFKLKLGYGDDEDRKNIRRLKVILGNQACVAVDVNRSWNFEQTVGWMECLRDNEIAWLEEPLDMIDQHRYPELAETSLVPISAGENFLIPPGTDFMTEHEWGLSLNESNLALDIIQPAIVKNCCFSDAVRLITYVQKRGKKLYPHFLGSAPGMAASANLAALTLFPHLEWDINPNPLRTDCFTDTFRAAGGYLHLSDAPGIGWEIDDKVLDKWAVDRVIVTQK